MARLLLGAAQAGGRQQSQNEDYYTAKTHLAQIKSVDTKNGRVSLALRQVSSGGQPATVVMPIGGLSVDQARSSWQRYMPSTGAYVKVGYGIGQHLEVLGYATPPVESAQGVDGQAAGDGSGTVSTNQRTGAGDAHTNGFAVLRKLAEAARGAGESGVAEANGLASFRDLQEGEMDWRSSGGAEVFLSRAGRVQLSTGLTQFFLDKETDAGVLEAPWLSFGAKQSRLGVLPLPSVSPSAASFMRLGQVRRRFDPTSTTRSAIRTVANTVGVLPVPNTIFDNPQEYVLSLGSDDEQATALAAPRALLYEERAGVVYAENDQAAPAGETAVPVLFKNVGLPLRYRKRVYGATGLAATPDALRIAAWEVQIDAVGNVAVSQSATAALGISVTSLGAAGLDATFAGPVRVQGGGPVRVQGGPLLTADALQVQLGSLATLLDGALIKGPALLEAIAAGGVTLKEVGAALVGNPLTEQASIALIAVAEVLTSIASQPVLSIKVATE